MDFHAPGNDKRTGNSDDAQRKARRIVWLERASGLVLLVVLLSFAVVIRSGAGL